MKYIYLHEPYISKDSIKYLTKSINSNFVSSSGEYILKCKNKLLNFISSKYVTLIVNGSSAIFLTLKFFRIKRGDEVIVPNLSFVAPTNAVIKLGCKPIFFDSRKNFNMDIEKIINFINHNTFKKNGFTFNSKSKKKIFAIIYVHTFGIIENINKLKKLCKKSSIFLIEDCSESLGSKLKNNNKPYIIQGDAAITSFNGNKIATMGNGGAIFSNHEKLIKDIAYYVNQSKEEGYKFIHKMHGFNYRISNINCALGYSQLLNLNKNIKKKKSIHLFYKKYFYKSNHFSLFSPNYIKMSNYWLNVVTINKKYRGHFNVDNLIVFFERNKIQLRPIWILNKDHNFCKKYELFSNSITKDIQNYSFNIPSSPILNRDQLKYITSVFDNFILSLDIY